MTTGAERQQPPQANQINAIMRAAIAYQSSDGQWVAKIRSTPTLRGSGEDRASALAALRQEVQRLVSEERDGRS